MEEARAKANAIDTTASNRLWTNVLKEHKGDGHPSVPDVRIKAETVSARQQHEHGGIQGTVGIEA